MLIGSYPITGLRFGIAEGELSSLDFKDLADVHAISHSWNIELR